MRKNDTVATRRQFGLGVGVACLAMVLLAPAAFGQASKKNGAAGKADDAKMKEYLEGSTEEARETLDGVILHLRYWAPRGADKETPVVVLLHQIEQQQREWFLFAKFLQTEGMAVVAFDFRGHGESVEVNPLLYHSPRETKKPRPNRNPNPNDATHERISYESYRSGAEIGTHLSKDMETIKRFLIEKNNAGQLNMRRLGIVAAGSSAGVAMNWFANYEFRAQGKVGWAAHAPDVDALVLITPEWNYRGLTIHGTLPKMMGTVPLLLISPEDGPRFEDARRFATLFDLPDLGDNTLDRESPRYRPKSGWIKVKTKLLGTELLRPPVFELEKKMAGFLKGRLNEDKGRVWARRETTLDLRGSETGR